MAFYRRNLSHLQRDSQPHFVTFCTKPPGVLLEWVRQIVLDCCLHDDGSKYNLHTAVVMPDHVHLILAPMVDVEQRAMVQVFEIMKAIKGTSAHAINRQLGCRGTVWQEASFDRVIRSSESLDEKIGYVIANPVRRGLAGLPGEYPWLWTKPVRATRLILTRISPSTLGEGRADEGVRPCSAQSVIPAATLPLPTPYPCRII